MNDRLKSLGITHGNLAERLGLSSSAISMKLHGHRPWKREEIDAVLELAREKDPTITYEQLFAPEAAVA